MGPSTTPPTSPSANLVVAPAQAHLLRITLKQGPNLPPQDRDSLRHLAIASAWQYRMLDSPVHVSRKCPVLPRFIPRTVGHGISIPTDDHAAFKSTAPFHGAQVDPVDGIDGCPYYNQS